jgi:heptosyltransferase-3
MKKILVCIFKYHGDVLLTSPVYTALRAEYPEASIDVYLFKDTLPMLEGHPAISKFLLFDQKWRKFSKIRRLYQELKMWAKVRKERYEAVLNLTSGDRGALIALISGAKIRIGIQRGGGMKQKDRFFTKIVRNTLQPRHIVERNLDLVRALNINPKEKDLVFHIPEEEKEKVLAILPYNDFILIHPASRCHYKHWPIEKFIKLIKELRERGEKIIISGGPGKEEGELISLIMNSFKNDPHVTSLAGKVSLKGLGALIEKSKLLVSVDSVPPHIASALKKRVLVIFGPSDDIKWGPWNNPYARVVRMNVPCMRCDQEGCGGTWKSDCLDNLLVEVVLNAILEMNSL